jgi:hypothetical protein
MKKKKKKKCHEIEYFSDFETKRSNNNAKAFIRLTLLQLSYGSVD